MRSGGRHIIRLVRENRSRLDFDLSPIFDEGGDLHGGHRGKILSHDAAIDLPDLGQTIDVFALVDEVPDEVRDVLRPRAFAGEDGSDVAQRLRDLRDEIVALKPPLGVPADLARKEDRPTSRNDAVGVACGPGPAYWLQGAMHERLLESVHQRQRDFTSSRAMISFCTSVAPS